VCASPRRGRRECSELLRWKPDDALVGLGCVAEVRRGVRGGGGIMNTLSILTPIEKGRFGSFSNLLFHFDTRPFWQTGTDVDMNWEEKIATAVAIHTAAQLLLY
jgi:hypothetical protein